MYTKFRKMWALLPLEATGCHYTSKSYITVSFNLILTMVVAPGIKPGLVKY